MLAPSENLPLTAQRFRATPKLRLWGAVLLSRVLVLAGAVLGATLSRRTAYWQTNDPHHLTLRLGSLGNVLAAGSVRWDSLHYLSVAEHGYLTATNTVFFPLYPALIHVVGWLTQSDVIAGVLISLVAFATSLLLLHRLTEEELGRPAADATVLLLAFSPVSLFFSAIYTESLFLALCLATFLWARRARWVRAGLAAALATLTHVEGVLLIAPLLMMYWYTERDAPPACPEVPARWSRRAAGRPAILLLPLPALAGFLIFLHSRGYGWLAPSANESGYGHHLAGPLAGAVQGVTAGISGFVHLLTGTAGVAARDDAFQNLVYLVVLVICIGSIAMAWRRLPRAYGVFSAMCLLMCVSSPVSGAPLTSLDRYVLVIFPIWMIAAEWLLAHRRLGPALLACGSMLLVFSFQFARWAFVG